MWSRWADDRTGLSPVPARFTGGGAWLPYPAVMRETGGRTPRPAARGGRVRRRRRARRRQRVSVLALAGVVLGCLTAFASASGDPSALAPGDEQAAPVEAAAEVEVGAPPAAPELLAGPVTVAAAGDIHGEPPLRAALLEGANPLEEVAPVLAAADLAVVNVETAVGTDGTPAPDKQYTFQAPPALWTALVASGVDVATLANNHALDFGVDGLEETIAGARAAGLAVVGAGADAEEAYAPVVVDVRGRTVAVVGLSRVLPVIEWAATDERPGLASAYDEEAAVAAVQAAALLADHVVVALHWGQEVEDCPDQHQRRLAAALVEAGADVIAGHHPHVLQGVAEEDGTVVAYSLGNFAWYSKGGLSAQTGVLTATLDEAGATATFTPAVIGSDGWPRPVEGEDAAVATARVEELFPGEGCPA